MKELQRETEEIYLKVNLYKIKAMTEEVKLVGNEIN